MLRLEKAAYGLAEAPRAWFARLSRELIGAGLQQSQLDPCLFFLRQDKVLKGVCGVHMDDLIGGGSPEMDEVLSRLHKNCRLEISEAIQLGTRESKFVKIPPA